MELTFLKLNMSQQSTFLDCIFCSFCQLNKAHENYYNTLANFQFSERGSNERKCYKKRDIPKFPTLLHTDFEKKRDT